MDESEPMGDHMMRGDGLGPKSHKRKEYIVILNAIKIIDQCQEREKKV